MGVSDVGRVAEGEKRQHNKKEYKGGKRFLVEASVDVEDKKMGIK